MLPLPSRAVAPSGSSKPLFASCAWIMFVSVSIRIVVIRMCFCVNMCFTVYLPYIVCLIFKNEIIHYIISGVMWTMCMPSAGCVGRSDLRHVCPNRQINGMNAFWHSPDYTDCAEERGFE